LIETLKQVYQLLWFSSHTQAANFLFFNNR
jgi:hypothetical protein